MSTIWRLAMNDLRLTARDRPAALWLFVLPIALMGFFGMMGGGGGRTTPAVGLGVDDRDGGWLAVALVAELDRRGVALQTEPGDTPPPRTLRIPPGTTAGVLAGEPQTLVLETRADASADFTFAAQTHVTRTIVAILGRLVEQRLAGSEPTAEGTAALAGRPPRVDVEVTTAGRGTPVPSGPAQSVPGMLTMMVLMMTAIYGAVFLTQERDSGMLRRQCVAPIGRGRLIAGKWLGRFLIGGVQTAVLVAAGRYLYGVRFGDPVGLLVLLAAYVAVVAAIATWLGAISRDAGHASALGWILALVMAALGGCWWPAEVMPEWMRTVARALPTTWAMEGFHRLISFGDGLAGVWPSAAALVVFAVAFTALGVRRLEI